MCALVYPRQTSPNEIVSIRRDVELHPLVFGLIDPDASMNLVKHLGLALFRLVARTGFGLDHPRIAPVDHL